MRERLRIAHDLHDTLVQSLVALAPQLHLIRKVAGRDANPRVIDELARAEQAVRDGLALARAALTDLRADNVESQGLGAALETLGLRFTDRTGIHVLADLNQRAGAAEGWRAEALYRICEEALRNIEWHASASRVELALSVDDSGALTLVVADDGVGYDPDRIKAGHFGLIGMREKAESIGARFTLGTAPGKGVRIQIVAPPLPPD
jgi:signal transduction histidine kinase